MRAFVLSFLLFASMSFGQKKAGLTTLASQKAAITHQSSASCPDQGGLLDSISVPINQPLQLSVFIFEPSTIDEVFDVSVDNPAIANAGDPTQGFLGEVTVPAGSQTSNPFTVLGSTIGEANVILQSLSGDFGTSVTPIGPWDVNPGNDSFPFVDANPPNSPCLITGSANLSTDPNVLANCGSPVYGLASDGVTQLLLRTAGGIPGTMCYAITSASSLDQGSIQTGVLSTQSGPNNYQYGFTSYTAPQYYGDTSDSRTVDVLFTFTPDQGNGNTTTIPGTLTVVRPPIMLLHGLWANAGSWNSNYARNDAFHTTYAGDYSATNGSSFSVNEPYVDQAVQIALSQFRQKQYAATQADVIAHSMGGILTRLYAGSNSFQQPSNYNQGDIRRLVTLDTPHFGSSFANLLVDLYQANPSKTVSTVSGLTGGSVTQGAVCDLAENSPALATLSGGTPLSSQVITATGGPAGTPSSPALYWGGATVFGIKSFESALTAQY
jgi:pimeloyl-ACP methyl ester carboxylesterase